MKNCTRCGTPFERRDHGPGRCYCVECARAIRRERYLIERNRAKANAPKEKRDGGATPVTVIGIDETVTCPDLREDLHICFYKHVFNMADFKLSVKLHCFDGLVVTMDERKYAVRRGVMVAI